MPLFKTHPTFQHFKPHVAEQLRELRDVVAIDNLQKVNHEGETPVYQGKLTRLTVADILSTPALLPRYLETMEEIAHERALEADNLKKIGQIDVVPVDPKNLFHRKDFLKDVSERFVKKHYDHMDTLSWPRTPKEMKPDLNEIDAEDFLKLFDIHQVVTTYSEETVRRESMAHDHFRMQCIQVLEKYVSFCPEDKMGDVIYLVDNLRKDIGQRIIFAELVPALKSVGLTIGERQMYHLRGAERNILNWFNRVTPDEKFIQGHLKEIDKVKTELIKTKNLNQPLHQINTGTDKALANMSLALLGFKMERAEAPLPILKPSREREIIEGYNVGAQLLLDTLASMVDFPDEPMEVEPVSTKSIKPPKPARTGEASVKSTSTLTLNEMKNAMAPLFPEPNLEAFFKPTYPSPAPTFPVKPAQFVPVSTIAQQLPVTEEVVLKAPPVRAGFANTGNSCYANSTLKHIFINYRDDILFHLSALKRDEKVAKDPLLLKALDQFIRISLLSLRAETVSEKDMQAFFKSLSALPRFQNFNLNGVQQDATEFYYALADVFKLDALLLRHSKTSVEYLYKTGQGGNAPPCALQLNLNDVVSQNIPLTLQNYFDFGILEKPECSSKIHVSLSQLKEIEMVINPYSQSYGQDANGQFQVKIEKISQRVPEFDVEEVVTVPVFDDETREHYQVHLQLKSFVTHLGGTTGGHYLMYARDPEGGWIKHNDSMVTHQTQVDPYDRHPLITRFKVLSIEAVKSKPEEQKLQKKDSEADLMTVTKL